MQSKAKYSSKKLLPERGQFAGRPEYCSLYFVMNGFDLGILTFRIVSITIFLKLTNIL